MESTDCTNNRAWVSPNLFCQVIRYEKCGELNLSINPLLVVEFFLTYAQRPDMLLMKENDGDDNGYLIFVLSANSPILSSSDVIDDGYC